VTSEAMPVAERQALMNGANPKYILRNHMALEAYEAAARGDYTVLEQVQALLQKPYEDQGEEANERFARPTPDWARDRKGLTYMS